MASACDAASWLVTETLLTLIATYFFLLMKGLIWSSMAASASAMFLRRLSPLTSETTELVSGAACIANGAQAGARAAKRIISRRVKRRDVMARPPQTVEFAGAAIMPTGLPAWRAEARSTMKPEFNIL